MALIKYGATCQSSQDTRDVSTTNSCVRTIDGNSSTSLYWTAVYTDKLWLEIKLPDVYVIERLSLNVSGLHYIKSLNVTMEPEVGTVTSHERHQYKLSTHLYE